MVLVPPYYKLLPNNNNNNNCKMLCITVTFVCVSDINELNLPKTCEINFPDDDDLLNFRLIISPDEVCVCVSVCRTGNIGFLQEFGSDESQNLARCV